MPAAQRRQAARCRTHATAAGSRWPWQRAPLLHTSQVLLALLLLRLSLQAAEPVLAPQTGDWLAGCGRMACLAVAAVASLMAAARAALGGGGLASGGWWLASAAALAAKAAARAVGSAILSPGLAHGAPRHWGTAEVTGRSLALAALALGPLCAALGWQAGGGVAALVPLPPARLLLAPLAVAAAAALLPVPALPKPPCALPAAVAVLAAAAAWLCNCGSGGRQRARLAIAAAALAAVAACAAAQLSACAACHPVLQELAGGRYSMLWRCETRAGGTLAVLEGSLGQYRYRVLRLGHSILGGHYLAPPDAAGQSVYTAFEVQAAGALLLRPLGGDRAAEGSTPARALLLGLGVGTALRGLAAAGVPADVLELHGEVAAAAERYFGAALPPRHAPSAARGLDPGRSWALAGDALASVPLLPDGRYHLAIHDAFSGGGIAPALLAPRFLARLRAKLRPGGSGRRAGVMALNLYATAGGHQLASATCALRAAGFRSVRAFGETDREPGGWSRAQNYVLFASADDLHDVELHAAAAVAAEGEADPQRRAVLRGLAQQEATPLLPGPQACARLLADESAPWWTRASLRGAAALWCEAHAAAVEHWLVMREQTADEVWLAY